MNNTKISSFNTEPLVIEIENVIKKGLNVLLKDYISRYDLLENTHKQIMNLPSVLNELNLTSFDKLNQNKEETEETESMYVSIKDITRNLVREEMANIEKKLDAMENRYDSIVPILAKKGDIVVANTIAFHKGTKPKTKDRYIIIFNFGLHKDYIGYKPDVTPAISRKFFDSISDINQKKILTLLEKD